MMVQRFLVRDDATSASGEDRLMYRPKQRAPIFINESEQAAPARPTKLFAETMLENSSTRPPHRVGGFVVSATAQVLFLAILLLVPLYFTEAIDIHQFNRALLVAPPPAPAPPPPPRLARSVAPKRRALAVVAKLVMPRVIPNRVARPSEEPGGNDLAAAVIPDAGVPGGIPGGQPGGVIGGALTGAAPPPPIDSAPKGPIRVGRGVKRPRLIFGPNPVFPVLARQAGISGAVVIDAVIDTQGNVVEMRTVSGHPILVLATMEALRHWKYEPTILAGEAISVELLVTLTFVSKGPQA